MSVRRKVDPAMVPPRDLAEFDAQRWSPPGVAHNDPWLPIRAHERWRAARAAWVSAGGAWPGGEARRTHEETASWPDEPWDGTS